MQQEKLERMLSDLKGKYPAVDILALAAAVRIACSKWTITETRRYGGRIEDALIDLNNEG